MNDKMESTNNFTLPLEKTIKFDPLLGMANVNYKGINFKIETQGQEIKILAQRSTQLADIEIGYIVKGPKLDGGISGVIRMPGYFDCIAEFSTEGSEYIITPFKEDLKISERFFHSPIMFLLEYFISEEEKYSNQ